MFETGIRIPDIEERVLAFWRKTAAFARSKELSKDRPNYVFYDGPPFATGLPHYGHILSGTIKDAVGRFMYQQGYNVPRRFGWDCHGLPVEYEIDKRLGIVNRSEVLEMGIARYNEECRSIVMKYAGEWERTVERMGRWVDFVDGYKTMDVAFMESTWFIFAQLFMRGKIYRGYKVMPFSTACKTPLSNFEANQNYKDVSDPSVLIGFPLVGGIDGVDVELVAWTTTPWTLPANCALVVNGKYEYAIFEHAGRYCVMLESRIPAYLKDVTVVGRVSGATLVGREYRPPFDYYEEKRADGFFRVLGADYVTDTSGTAIVHCAPAFGEEDYAVCVANGLLRENGEAPCPVDENGLFTLEPYRGVYIKDVDKLVLRDIRDRVLMNARVVHSYPFCWRSDTPLIYRLVPNWFVRVGDARDALLRNNELINWEPKDIKYRRFHNWLAQARDWAIGRNRFWGTPIPIWRNIEDENDLICVGSVDELAVLSGTIVSDLHRESVDGIVIEQNGKKYRRVDEVLDCWFESGAMPYAQGHWPFCDNDATEGVRDADFIRQNYGSAANRLSKDEFPADFIGEGLDQTRGWFYTLHVLSTLLFDQPAFKNVICFGIVLAEDGKKMSKRLKNYPDPLEVFNKHGADALRLYLLSSPVVAAENLRFSEGGVLEINKIILIPWANSLSFYMDCKDGQEDALAQRVSDCSTEHSTSCSATMDNWIRASLSKLVVDITTSAQQLHLNDVLPAALRFIDDLSNWYIRINRKALRTDASLLRRTLLDLSVVMAPFTPFFSEYCYQSIKGKHGAPAHDTESASVHHCLYPKTSAIEHPFDQAKRVIIAIRQLRESKRLKLKRPLRMVTIVCDSSLEAILLPFATLIQAECNLLAIQYARIEDYDYSTSVKPFFDNLRKHPGTMKAKIAVLNRLAKAQSEQLIKHGHIEAQDAAGQPLTIDLSDALIERSFKKIENAGMFGDFGLIFDVSLDQEIVERTEAREFYSFIQKLRKTSGLVLSDTVYIGIKNSYLQDICTRYYPEMLFGVKEQKFCDASYMHDDEAVKVTLYKV